MFCAVNGCFSFKTQFLALPFQMRVCGRTDLRLINQHPNHAFCTGVARMGRLILKKLAAKPNKKKYIYDRASSDLYLPQTNCILFLHETCVWMVNVCISIHMQLNKKKITI